jgi:membrane-associated phospholipid phosphatase
MPSGHTTEVTGSAGCLAQLQGDRIKPLLWGLLPALICFSRLYAGMHHSIDIIAGAFLGSLTSLFVLWALNNPNVCPTWKRNLHLRLNGSPSPDKTN